MRFKSLSIGLALPALLVLVALQPEAVEAQSTVHVWQKWEQTLTSTKSPFYANAYRDVILTATLSQSQSGQSYTIRGFWDGGTTFKIRFAFPSTGTWTWTTSCEGGGCSAASDAGLNRTDAATQSVNVQAYTGSNTLYKRGLLSTASECVNSPTLQCPLSWLIHGGDQTPFFWLGDTAWAAPVRAALPNWQTYVNDRRDKGFTVIQIAAAPNWGLNGPPSQSSPAFDVVETKACTSPDPIPNSCSIWNPTYWRNFDALVDIANQAGLLVAVVGLMDPIDRDLYPTPTDATIFARNLLARLSGSAVAVSPAFDDKVSQQLALMQAVGEELQPRVYPGRLTTNHQASDKDNPVQPQTSHNQNWLMLDMQVSGNGGGAMPLEQAMQRARENLQQVRALGTSTNTAKPLVNGEAMYDGNLPNANEEVFTPYRARQAGYLSLLSGAGGYTYGAYGIYDWGRRTGVNWNESRNWPGADHMKQLGMSFKNLAWYRLLGTAEEHARIKNNPPEQSRKMVLARDASNLLLAYLPEENTQIKIDMNGIAGWPEQWTKVWVDPRGDLIPQPVALSNTGTLYSFSNRPDCTPCDAGDWILRLTRTSAAAAWMSSRPSRLDVFDGFSKASNSLDLFLQVRLADGSVQGEPIPLGVSSEDETSPRIAQDAHGNHVVVWQSAMNGVTSLWVQKVSAEGNALAPPERIYTDPRGRALRPVVATDPEGRSLVAWTGEDADGRGLWAQRLMSSGQRAEAAFLVHPSSPGDQDFAQISADAEGRFAIAWERRTDADSAAQILLRLFDAEGSALSEAILVSSEGSALLSLTDVVKDALGEVTVLWERFDALGRSTGLYGRRYDAIGRALTSAAPFSGPSVLE